MPARQSALAVAAFGQLALKVVLQPNASLQHMCSLQAGQAVACQTGAGDEASFELCCAKGFWLNLLTSHCTLLARNKRAAAGYRRAGRAERGSQKASSRVPRVQRAPTRASGAAVAMAAAAAAAGSRHNRRAQGLAHAWACAWTPSGAACAGDAARGALALRAL
jgi:hypothetical protein